MAWICSAAWPDFSPPYTPVSADTLLRMLRRPAAPTPSDVRVVGIDDFAWLKGQRYGTIICNLERRRTVDLPPDREGANRRGLARSASRH